MLLHHFLVLATILSTLSVKTNMMLANSSFRNYPGKGQDKGQDSEKWGHMKCTMSIIRRFPLQRRCIRRWIRVDRSLRLLLRLCSSGIEEKEQSEQYERWPFHYNICSFVPFPFFTIRKDRTSKRTNKYPFEALMRLNNSSIGRIRRIVVAFVLIYLICWTPYWIVFWLTSLMELPRYGWAPEIENYIRVKFVIVLLYIHFFYTNYEELISLRDFKPKQ